LRPDCVKGAATVALGIAAGAYELALAYSQEREQFAGRFASSRVCNGGSPTWRRKSPRRACRFKAAACPEDGFPDVTEAAQAKMFASEMAIKVTNDALQIFGRRDIRATSRLSGWCAMPACSRSVAAPRRSCVPSSPRGCSAGSCRSHVTVTAGGPCRNELRGRYRAGGRCGMALDADNELAG
jgi:alkylation response protein AidB-like acyl-CoA dehydrogenase